MQFLHFGKCVGLPHVLLQCLKGIRQPQPRDWDQRIQWDRNALSWVDREYYMYVRGLALNLIRWISCNYDATSLQSQHPVQSFERNFCGHYLTDQACAILSYKQKAQDENIPTIPYCKFSDVERQVDYVFHDDEESLFADWREKRSRFQNFTSLACTSKVFVITKKNPPREFKGGHLQICAIHSLAILHSYGSRQNWFQSG